MSKEKNEPICITDFWAVSLDRSCAGILTCAAVEKHRGHGDAQRKVDWTPSAVRLNDMLGVPAFVRLIPRQEQRRAGQLGSAAT